LGNIDFARLVREQGGRIYNTVYCILGNETDAEDVAQEVFMRAYQHLAGFKGNSDISTWLYRIAMNVVSDQIRKNKRNSNLREAFSREELEESGHAGRGNGNPETTYLEKELSEAVQGALLRLPLKFRTVVVLKEIEGYSYKEIGNILGISIGTVESRLFRARGMLRENLMNTITNSEKSGDTNEEVQALQKSTEVR
jgi:RNA polymerase sigma-70 factor, ECF subfamily